MLITELRRPRSVEFASPWNCLSRPLAQGHQQGRPRLRSRSWPAQGTAHKVFLRRFSGTILPIPQKRGCRIRSVSQQDVREPGNRYASADSKPERRSPPPANVDMGVLSMETEAAHQRRVAKENAKPKPTW